MSVFSYYDKKGHFLRADELLSCNDIDKAKYAALELRFLIEAIVYQKLVKCSADIPESIVNTWQPNKALRMLYELNSLSVSSFELQVNLTNCPQPPKDGWISLGEQKIPKVSRLNTLYNKLGSFLHLTEPKRYGKCIDKNVIDQIKEVRDELEEFVDGNIVVSFGKIKHALCPICQGDFFFNRSKIKSGDVVRCKESSCGSTFVCKIDSESGYVSFDYRTYDICCQKCNATIIVPEDTVMSLGKFLCSECGAEYIFAREYSYAVVNDNKN